MSGRWKLAAGAAIAAAFLAGKVLYESRREWREGAALLSSGQVEEGIRHFERSIHWYLPANPYTGRSVEALWRIGQEEERKNRAGALLAYDALRGSLHAIRSFYWPYRSWILKADERIAELRAREQTERRTDLTYEKALAFHRSVLVPTDRPRILWVFLVQIGFWGWLISVAGWIRKGFDGEGRMNLRPSIPWMAAIVLFFAAWLLGLARA